MQTITINEYSYDIDFQAFVDGLSAVDSGETVCAWWSCFGRQGKGKWC